MIRDLFYNLFNYFNRFLDITGFGLYRKTSSRLVSELIRELKPRKAEVNLIRVGSQNDGGYLIPDELDGIEAIYSPGVDKNSSFEMFFAEKGIPCFLLDYSIENLPQEHPNFKFLKKFLGTENTDKTITLDMWIDKNIQSNNLLLQMDIEGSEWEVLNQANLNELERFRILVIEFHGLPERIASRTSYETTNSIFKKLRNSFEILHVHANNGGKSILTQGIYIPEVLEITFIRKDRIRGKTTLASIPHPLDQENVEMNKSIRIPKYWQI